jgi:tRNA-dihydrouridine synthase B
MSLLKQIKIGDTVTPNNVWLAPLAGIGDRSYRTLHRRFGAGLTFSEMTSAHGIVRGNSRTLELARISRGERPSGIQIFGSNPEIMGSAVASLCEYPADVIDINGGCSVPKVIKTGAGARLLEDPGLFYAVVKACVDASIRPVSVKMRLGLSEDRINVVENALAAQEAGASLLTLHPRTAEEKYRGPARWEYIGFVKQSLAIPVCGNGDITTPHDAVRMILETGCDAVMIGRAAIGNPWLIQDTVCALDAYPEQIEVTQPSVAERVRCALEHLNLIVSLKGEARGMREIQRHLYRYLRGIPHVVRLRESLCLLDSKQEAEARLLALLHESIPQ